VLSAVAGTRGSGIGARPPTEVKWRSLAVADTEMHGAEHAVPHAVPMPEQPSSAIANGAATSENSTMTTITPHRISSPVSQSRTDRASGRFAQLRPAFNSRPLCSPFRPQRSIRGSPSRPHCEPREPLARARVL